MGGLVGGVQYKVTNCYTGGTITIGSDNLMSAWTRAEALSP
ncbi:MAG: hypothetical protein ACLUEU_10850 [Oscillospiraceae bacterium]